MFFFLLRNKNHPLINPNYGTALTTPTASTKETGHHLRGATDGHRTMELRGMGSGRRGTGSGRRGPAPVHARRPPLWGRRGPTGFSESRLGSSKTQHTVEDGGGDGMQLQSLRRPSVAEHSPGGGGGGASVRHDTHVHRADHDLRTSPCDPNSRLFSVRAGQQSSPYILSILTRKGDRVGGPGSPGAVVPAVDTGNVSSVHGGRPPAGAAETWGRRLPAPSPPPRRRSPRC